MTEASFCKITLYIIKIYLIN